jgi:hypothetical protein
VLNEFALDDHDLRAVAGEMKLAGHEPEVPIRQTEIDVSPRPASLEPEQEAPPVPVPVEAASDPARSAVWPLALALVVGLALGFGSAMLLLGPDQTATVQDTAAGARRPPPVALVEEPIRPVPDSPTAAPPPAQRPAGEPDAIPEPPALSPVPLNQNPGTAANRPGASAAPAAPADSRSADASKPPVSSPPAAPRPATRPSPSAARTPERPAAEKPAPSPARPKAASPRAAPPAAAPAAAAKPGPGSVVVESRPDAAIIILDGKIVGKTPLTIETLAAGHHTVSLDRPGYRRWVSSFQVTSGERTRVAASLER